MNRTPNGVVLPLEEPKATGDAMKYRCPPNKNENGSEQTNEDVDGGRTL